MPRAELEIFAELSDLCVSPGFIHAIAYICLRDNMIKFSGEMTTDDMWNLYGRERLIRNEINVLIGLLIKKTIDFTDPGVDELKRYVARAHEALDEIHHSILAPVVPLTPGDMAALGAALSSGAVMRESIFYGGESAYMFQYRDFAPERYAQDDSWIVANQGFSMREAANVVKAVGALHNEKCTTAFRAQEKDSPSAFDSLPSYEFTAVEISALSGVAQDTVSRILSAFALPAEERNSGFAAVDAPNAAAITPLLRRGEKFILFNIFDLSEVLCQAPYFWMLGDRAHQPSASKHRGEFTENFAQSRLAAVFGAKNVQTNVNIVRARTVVGEIDVLVIFGDVAIVVQAKSKQLTALARVEMKRS
jgi:hypothetical protein